MRRHPLGAAGAFVILAVVFLAAAAEIIAPYDFSQPAARLTACKGRVPPISLAPTTSAGIPSAAFSSARGSP